MKTGFYRRLIVVPLVVLTAQVFAPSAGAMHSWAGFHWARTENPLKLQLGRNLSGVWMDQSLLESTSNAWSTGAVEYGATKVVDTTVVPGGSNARRCAPTAGRVEVCNSAYGKNGWLGLASVWASGSHVTQATVKLNDSYFNTPSYNTDAWRNSVMCQEVGHTLGLTHNDEDFNTVICTCMDYANDPSLNQQPNHHDFEQLAKIYTHFDNTNTAISSAGSANRAASDLNGQDEWGRAVRFASDGRPVVFERDLGRGERMFTFVTWAE